MICFPSPGINGGKRYAAFFSSLERTRHQCCTMEFGFTNVIFGHFFRRVFLERKRESFRKVSGNDPDVCHAKCDTESFAEGCATLWKKLCRGKVCPLSSRCEAWGIVPENILLVISYPVCVSFLMLCLSFGFCHLKFATTPSTRRRVEGTSLSATVECAFGASCADSFASS